MITITTGSDGRCFMLTMLLNSDLKGGISNELIILRQYQAIGYV